MAVQEVLQTPEPFQQLISTDHTAPIVREGCERTVLPVLQLATKLCLKRIPMDILNKFQQVMFTRNPLSLVRSIEEATSTILLFVERLCMPVEKVRELLRHKA